MSSLKKRHEIPVNERWDLTHLFKNQEEILKTLADLEQVLKNFLLYKGKSLSEDEILQALSIYEEMYIKISHLNNYASLSLSVDFTDVDNRNLSNEIREKTIQYLAQLSFFNSFLFALDSKTLKSLLEKDPKHSVLYREILHQKDHQLSPEVEETLAHYGHLFSNAFDSYETLKLADMSFEAFEYKGKTYPMSFVLFENEYQSSSDTEFRRLAFKSFSKTLRKYGHSIAHFYETELKTQKVNAKLRKYHSVREMLLSNQFMRLEVQDKHLDYLLEHFAPLMRRYARLIQKRYQLEQIHFSDLKAPLFPEKMPESNAEEAKKLCLDALAVMGEDYVKRVKAIFDRRQIDWALNEGKSTGGFCASPYQKPGYILLSWNGLLSEVFTLIHEIGHCVHFDLAHEHNSFFNTDPSLYCIEGPSTINELLLTEHLLKVLPEEDQMFVIASMLSNTYYHNMVTHFIEALFQRAVYQALEQNQALGFDVFCRLMKEAHQAFWGDTVELDDEAELTWMRQPHYYMGLYPYTYSAGLSLGTCMANRIAQGDQEAKQLWLSALASGGVNTPDTFFQKLGLSLDKQEALSETVHYVDGLIQKLEKHIV